MLPGVVCDVTPDTSTILPLSTEPVTVISGSLDRCLASALYHDLLLGYVGYDSLSGSLTVFKKV